MSCPASELLCSADRPSARKRCSRSAWISKLSQIPRPSNPAPDPPRPCCYVSSWAKRREKELLSLYLFIFLSIYLFFTAFLNRHVLLRALERLHPPQRPQLVDLEGRKGDGDKESGRGGEEEGTKEKKRSHKIGQTVGLMLHRFIFHIMYLAYAIRNHLKICVSTTQFFLLYSDPPSRWRAFLPEWGSSDLISAEIFFHLVHR